MKSLFNDWRRGLMLCGAVILFAGSVGLGYVAGQPPAAVVEASPPFIDFGRVAQHSVPSGTAKIVNRGRQPLRIVEILKSCDCSSADVSTRTIPVGGAAELSVQWKVGDRHDDAATKVSVLLAEIEGAPGVHVVEVGLRSHVLADYSVRPDTLEFDRHGGVQQATLTFAPTGRTPNIALLGAYPNQVSLSVADAAAPNEIVVKFDPAQLPPDRGSAEVAIKTNSVSESVRRVTVSFK